MGRGGQLVLLYKLYNRLDWAGASLMTTGWASELIHFFGPELVGRSAVDPALS